MPEVSPKRRMPPASSIEPPEQHSRGQFFLGGREPAQLLEYRWLWELGHPPARLLQICRKVRDNPGRIARLQPLARTEFSTEIVDPKVSVGQGEEVVYHHRVRGRAQPRNDVRKVR